MITVRTLNQLWQSISPQSGNTVGRRADPNHPLDFFITYDENNNMQLMLFSDRAVSLPKSSQEILVRQNQRVDGQYAICFSLNNNSLRDMFISLCWDLINCTEECASKSEGIHKAVKRFQKWQKLFTQQKNTGLSDEGFRGLLGELIVLTRVLAPVYGFGASVKAWTGPVFSDRDFEFADTWFEAKATSFSKESIQISSIDQLDSSASGKLVICRMEKTSPLQEKSITMRKLIADVSRELDDENIITLFNSRLLLAGLKDGDTRLDDPYIVHSVEQYAVEDDFPRIVRSNLPTAIIGGSYLIDIAAIQKWRV